MAKSALPVIVDLTAYHGDTWSQTFRLKRGDTPEDLSGAVVNSEVLSVTGQRFSLEVEVEADGLVTISMPSGSLPATVYSYDIQVMQGSVITTWVRGSLNVLRDVTVGV